MPNPLAPIIWMRLAAVALLTAATLGHVVADDNPPKAPDGYKMVPVRTADGKTSYVEVATQSDPFKHVSQAPAEAGKYDPTRLSATSSLGNKSFFTTNAQSSESKSSLYNSDHDAFITQPYKSSAPASWSQSGKSSTLVIPPSPQDAQKTASFNQNYATSTASLGDKSTYPLGSDKSSEQDRTSPLAGKSSNLAMNTYPYGTKTFLGPEADAVHKDSARLENGLMQLKDLPNRPLTIDEVRALINHGVKPNTDEPPTEPASKPLNDPDYKPQPLRDNPQPYNSDSDDKDAPVPPPGTMAQPPEDAQPLPNR